MSAQPVGPESSTRWQPDPVRQKQADYTLEDLLNLPPGAPRTELVNGVMLVVPSPTEAHQDISALLWSWLRQHAPTDFKAALALGVAVAVDHTFEPDVLLRRAGGDGSRHFVPADHVVLVVEVVSAHTKRRDRISKPAEYAAAGIPFYWRIEQDPVHVYAYRRGPQGTYDLVADGADVVELEEPFPLRLPISDITP
jgi:Uma2 family endonuclease